MAGIAKPDARSPNGKRPRAKVAADDALADADLSPGELTAAVKAIQAYLETTAQAVGWNCDLLNALVTRVNTIEAVSVTSVTAFEALLARTDPKLQELDGFGTSIAVALDKCDALAKSEDTRLRHELDKMTSVIDKGFSEIEEKIRKVSNVAPTSLG